MGLGITLLSRDAAAAALASGSLEEWRHGRLPLRREWHVVGRAGEELDPTAGLMLKHLGTARGDGERFRLRSSDTAPGGDSGPADP